MASVDFKKLKTPGDVAAMLRHNDGKERQIHNHANKDIDISRSSLNTQWLPLDYNQTLERYESRIKQLDETTNTNKRKDRVTCFSLCIPVPSEISDSEKFSGDIRNIIETEYGADNIINGYLHRDEVHDYIDHGLMKTSLEHLHILIVPEIDGKICGKKFSGKTAMITLNNKINDICLRKFGCSFLTGEPPQKKTVEQLKKEGEAELQQMRDNLSRTSGRIIDENEKTVTLPRESYDTLATKAALYDGRNEKALAETRAVRKAADEVEKKYNQAISLEYNAFEREIREKALISENDELRKKLDFIMRCLERLDEELSKHSGIIAKGVRIVIHKITDVVNNNERKIETGEIKSEIGTVK
ncbi:MAG: plasmid recombination protein [Clostridia bacterium]|nr:plasmid recombination protein [Clostridia bacterium]